MRYIYIRWWLFDYKSNNGSTVRVLLRLEFAQTEDNLEYGRPMGVALD